jgi:O-antigen/teichoic acid export membrane protein
MRPLEHPLLTPRVPHPARRLSSNLFWQLVGQALPLVIAAITIPVVHARVSAADFGIFTLSITAFGIMSVLDLGLGRASVRFVSRALALGDRETAARVAAQSLIILLVISVLICAICLRQGPLTVSRWLSVDASNDPQLRDVVRILALVLPAIALTSAMRSLMEAELRFRRIAAIQAISGALTFGSPLIVSLYTSNIRLIVLSAALVRASSLLVYGFGVRQWLRDPNFRNGLLARPSLEFLQFSGSLMVSNLVGTAVAYADRALLAGIIPLSRLPYYNVPLDFLLRFMLPINGAITVAFPELSRRATKPGDLDKINLIALSALGGLLGPALLLGSLLTPMFLSAWLGHDFRVTSSVLLQTFLIGFHLQAFNGLSMATLGARGIAGRIALMHVLEVPLYLFGLTFLGSHYGLRGLAVAWSARTLFEFLAFGTMIIAAAELRGRHFLVLMLAAMHTIPLLIVVTMHVNWAALLLSVVLTSLSVMIVRSQFLAVSEQPLPASAML